jgi:glycosyltransferase involved in cell wall biosynthesis
MNPNSASMPSLGSIHIFCPIYEPHPGGGGTYFPMLARFLSQYARTIVYTERHQLHRMVENKGPLSLWRVFLRRDTLSNKNLLNSALRYVANSLIFLVLVIRFLFLKGPTTIIFTRNYYAHYLLALRLLGRMRKDVVLVNDLRTELPRGMEGLDLSFFNLSLSNSLAIEQQLERQTNLRGRQHVHLKNMVAVPSATSTVRPPLNVVEQGYVLFCGTLSFRKTIDVVVPVMREIYAMRRLVPVLVGRPADHNAAWLAKQLRGVPYFYREYLPHLQLVWLEQHAALVMMPSRLEGLPRVVIETLTFHGRVVLPPCCPEFSDGLTVDMLSTQTVLAKALERIDKEYTGYDVSQHDPAVGLATYRSLLDQQHLLHRERLLQA